MSYSFPPNLQQLVEDALASGNYRNTDEMLVEAVQLLRDRDEQTKRLRDDLAARIRSLDAGEAIELEGDDDLRCYFDNIRTRGWARYEASKQQQ